MRIAIQGATKTPKLFTALQLAYGLCGAWERIIVIGSSTKEDKCQYLGNYNTLHIPADSTPQRYMEAFNLSAGCNKEVIIFSSFSNEWQSVESLLETSYYEEVLSAHGQLMRILRNSPVHVICCIETKQKFVRYDPQSKRHFAMVQQPIQQPDLERNFAVLMRVCLNGNAFTLKDTTEVLPRAKSYIVTPLEGAMFQEWCVKNQRKIHQSLLERIEACKCPDDLNRLIWYERIEGEELLALCTKRRLELEGQPSTDSSGTSRPDNKLHLVP